MLSQAKAKREAERPLNELDAALGASKRPLGMRLQLDMSEVWGFWHAMNGP